jgi:uncharacterized damage-inducible protein DinB
MPNEADRDPMLAAARAILEDALEAIRTATEGASPEALNWRPAGEETNSIAVLAVHAMHSTRSWLSIAADAPLPARDRDSEFRATADNAAALRASIEVLGAECRALLERPALPDWAVMRKTHARPSPDRPAEVSAAWALLHALEHLREHAGQMLLTRQLFDARTV